MSTGPTRSRSRPHRPRAAFEEVFGRSAPATLDAMERAGDDVPAQVPVHRWPLDRIGVCRTDIPVTIVDPLPGEGPVTLACRVDAFVRLDADRRGIHVSRIGDVLAELTDTVFPSLSAYAAVLAERLCAQQACPDGDVHVRGVLSYLEAVGGAAGKRSIEHLVLSAAAQRRAHTTTGSAGVRFHHLTACPCVQQTYKHSLGTGADRALPDRPGRLPPSFTHSQRCRTTVTITGPEAPPPLVELLAAIDAVVVRSQNTLPRDLELLATHRAHATPQFLEDVLRDLFAAVARRLAGSHPASTITIDARSFESIHDFDLVGALTGPVRPTSG